MTSFAGQRNWLLCRRHSKVQQSKRRRLLNTGESRAQSLPGSGGTNLYPHPAPPPFRGSYLGGKASSCCQCIKLAHSFGRACVKSQEDIAEKQICCGWTLVPLSSCRRGFVSVPRRARPAARGRCTCRVKSVATWLKLKIHKIHNVEGQNRTSSEKRRGWFQKSLLLSIIMF